MKSAQIPRVPAAVIPLLVVALTWICGTGGFAQPASAAAKEPGTEKALPSKSAEPSPPAERPPAPQIPSLEEMLAVALKHNPEVRAAEAKVRAAEADMDRTRLEVVQNIVAFRQRWQAQWQQLTVAEEELRSIEAAHRAGVKMSAAAAQAQARVALMRAKLGEIAAEMPFLLGSTARDVSTTTDPVRQKAEAMLKLAQQGYELTVEEFRTGKVDLMHTYPWSVRWMEAQRTLAQTKSERIAAVEAHVARLKPLEAITWSKYQAGQATMSEVVTMRFYVAQAELQLAQAKAE